MMGGEVCNKSNDIYNVLRIVLILAFYAWAQ